MKPGERIKSEREAQKLERKELAAKAGIPYPTLAGIENGDQSGSTKMHAIAAALGVSASWLETGRGRKLGVSEPSEKSQYSTLDADKLQASIQFLDEVFQAHGKAFVPSEKSLLIAAVYDELLRNPSPNWVALSIKYGRLAGGEDERKDEVGSAGKDDQGRARRRARKA